MKKSTRNWLIVGGVAAAGGLGYLYWKSKQPAVPSSGALVGTPVTAFTPGQKYTFAATIPAGISDNVALESALASAGWTSPNVVFFMGNGTLPPGFQGNASSYVATGTWNGAANAAVPPGVVAAATA